MADRCMADFYCYRHNLHLLDKTRIQFIERINRNSQFYFVSYETDTDEVFSLPFSRDKREFGIHLYRKINFETFSFTSRPTINAIFSHQSQAVM